MRTLVIGHDHVAGLGCLDLGPVTWLTVVGEDRFDDPDVAVTFPDPAAFDLVVTLGAPWPRERIAGWAEEEKRFLDGSRRAGAAVLGVCFGAQLVAEMLGGSTRPLPVPRLGWREVTPHDEGVAAGPWFSWHAAQLVPPPGATVLATDEDGVAAFRQGRCAGVQFHPEMTPGLLDRWLTVPGAPALDHLRRTTAERAAGSAAAVPNLLRALLPGTIRQDRSDFAPQDRKAAGTDQSHTTRLTCSSQGRTRRNVKDREAAEPADSNTAGSVAAERADRHEPPTSCRAPGGTPG